MGFIREATTQQVWSKYHTAASGDGEKPPRSGVAIALRGSITCPLKPANFIGLWSTLPRGYGSINNKGRKADSFGWLGGFLLNYCEYDTSSLKMPSVVCLFACCLFHTKFALDCGKMQCSPRMGVLKEVPEELQIWETPLLKRAMGILGEALIHFHGCLPSVLF